jgi:hypothetical protein
MSQTTALGCSLVALNQLGNSATSRFGKVNDFRVQFHTSDIVCQFFGELQLRKPLARLIVCGHFTALIDKNITRTKLGAQVNGVTDSDVIGRAVSHIIGVGMTYRISTLSSTNPTLIGAKRKAGDVPAREIREEVL